MTAAAPWSDSAIAALRIIYPRLTNKAVAYFFVRPVSEIEAMALWLALGKNKAVFGGHPMPRWSPEELSILNSLYPSHTNAEIGRALGRSSSSVMAKARRMKLKKSRARLAAMGIENVSKRRDRRNEQL